MLINQSVDNVSKSSPISLMTEAIIAAERIF